VTLLGLRLRPGQSIFDQLVFAAKKAFVTGEFAPGQTFPSVRTLAADLKIHPNTAHKVIQYLIQERWLVSKPGVGTVVADRPGSSSRERSTILQQQAEQIVVEAKRLGLEFDAVMQAVESEWIKLESPLEVRRK
jgi:GntR family transcriptional regulator